tara:strand:- start:59 stop:316 length:258 start_codon:yes stop_codon:yes gene_type:complete
MACITHDFDWYSSKSSSLGVHYETTIVEIIRTQHLINPTQNHKYNITLHLEDEKLNKKKFIKSISINGIGVIQLVTLLFKIRSPK